MSDDNLTLTGDPRKSNAGRKPGSKNKIKIPTDADLKESFKKASPHALQKLLHIMQNGSESNQLKVAFKILDTSVSIMYEDEKLTATKRKSGQTTPTTYTIETGSEEEEPTSGKVLKLV